MQINGTIGIDHAGDDDGVAAVSGSQGGSAQLTASQSVHIGIRLGGADARCSSQTQHFIHRRPGRRGHGQTAYIDHAGTANNEAVRVGKYDITADLAILQAVQRTVDLGTRVMDEVYEVGSRAGDVDIDDVAAVDDEVVEGVETCLATDRRGGDVGDIGVIRIDHHRRAGTAIHDNIVGMTPARQEARSEHQCRQWMAGELGGPDPLAGTPNGILARTHDNLPVDLPVNFLILNRRMTGHNALKHNLLTQDGTLVPCRGLGPSF